MRFYHTNTSVTCVTMAKCNSIRVPVIALLGDGGPRRERLIPRRTLGLNPSLSSLWTKNRWLSFKQVAGAW